METKTELILLQRTMIVIEGVASTLSPGTDMWKAAQPVVESWVRDNLGPKAMLADLVKSAGILARIAPHLPEMAETYVTRVERGEPGPTLDWRKEQQAWSVPGWLMFVIAGLSMAVGYLMASSPF
jgi:ubiquinone biosynthesis protein